MKIDNDLLKSDIITNTTTNKSVLIDLYDKVILTYINTNRLGTKIIFGESVQIIKMISNKLKILKKNAIL